MDSGVMKDIVLVAKAIVEIAQDIDYIRLNVGLRSHRDELPGVEALGAFVAKEEEREAAKGEDGKAVSKSFKNSPHKNSAEDLVAYLLLKMAQAGSGVKPPKSLLGWHREMELILRVDQYSVEQVKTAVDMAMRDSWYVRNLGSPKMLRKSMHKFINRISTADGRQPMPRPSIYDEADKQRGKD